MTADTHADRDMQTDRRLTDRQTNRDKQTNSLAE
jgi:hypothetical protein